MPDELKRCYKCDTCKTHSQFAIDRSRKDGRANVCKVCAAIRRKSRNARQTQARRLTAQMNPKPAVTEQRCWVCERVMLLDNFYKDKTSSTGHDRCCKSCSTEKRRGWRGAGYEKHKADQIVRQKNHSNSLSDAYLRHLLAKRTSLSRRQIPKELVSLKRLQVMINRKVNEVSQ
jgi:hypothetical protein